MKIVVKGFYVLIFAYKLQKFDKKTQVLGTVQAELNFMMNLVGKPLTRDACLDVLLNFIKSWLV